MGPLGLVATGVCSRIDAGINVIPFMIQRHAPGIGPNVLPAFLFAALPAVLAGLAYAVLASAFAAAWIEDLFHRGLAARCNAVPLLFCPGEAATRGQASVFLLHAFALP